MVSLRQSYTNKQVNPLPFQHIEQRLRETKNTQLTEKKGVSAGELRQIHLLLLLLGIGRRILLKGGIRNLKSQ